ncbi:conserved hypothetical protein [sediment metagenome]|uniref:DUF1638 domain-containing protein n=1 Tax=sediment metagenome TaxID=749907 RepID=D9PKM0_9ZZZZ
MSQAPDFKGHTIVSCGTLRRELDYLNKTNFLNADKIFYTAPGLHENSSEFKKQLKRQLEEAKKYSPKIIVVYGIRCYVDVKNPLRDIDKLIQETGANAKRIKAKSCIDMLVNIEEREKISEGKKVYWFTLGWLEYWKVIFKDWDQGKANETFPQHDKAILLDPIGMFEEYSSNAPEKILEFADWMCLNIEPYRIPLDRLKRLLLDEIF